MATEGAPRNSLVKLAKAGDLLWGDLCVRAMRDVEKGGRKVFDWSGC